MKEIKKGQINKLLTSAYLSSLNKNRKLNTNNKKYEPSINIYRRKLIKLTNSTNELINFTDQLNWKTMNYAFNPSNGTNLLIKDQHAYNLISMYYNGLRKEIEIQKKEDKGTKYNQQQNESIVLSTPYIKHTSSRTQISFFFVFTKSPHSNKVKKLKSRNSHLQSKKRSHNNINNIEQSKLLNNKIEWLNSIVRITNLKDRELIKNRILNNTGYILNNIKYTQINNIKNINKLNNVNNVNNVNNNDNENKNIFNIIDIGPMNTYYNLKLNKNLPTLKRNDNYINTILNNNISTLIKYYINNINKRNSSYIMKHGNETKKFFNNVSKTKVGSIINPYSINSRYNLLSRSNTPVNMSNNVNNNRNIRHLSTSTKFISNNQNKNINNINIKYKNTINEGINNYNSESEFNSVIGFNTINMSYIWNRLYFLTNRTRTENIKRVSDIIFNNLKTLTKKDSEFEGNDYNMIKTSLFNNLNIKDTNNLDVHSDINNRIKNIKLRLNKFSNIKYLSDYISDIYNNNSDIPNSRVYKVTDNRNYTLTNKNTSTSKSKYNITNKRTVDIIPIRLKYGTYNVDILANLIGKELRKIKIKRVLNNLYDRMNIIKLKELTEDKINEVSGPILSNNKMLLVNNSLLARIKPNLTKNDKYKNIELNNFVNVPNMLNNPINALTNYPQLIDLLSNKNYYGLNVSSRGRSSIIQSPETTRDKIMLGGKKAHSNYINNQTFLLGYNPTNRVVGNYTSCNKLGVTNVKIYLYNI